MYGKKLLLAGLTSSLLIGAAVTTSFAAPGGTPPGPGRFSHPRVSAEVLYVRMLKQFDANGDMKISKDELTAGVDKIFDQIDANKDGQITPGELRAYRQQRMQAWRDARKENAGAQDQASSQPQGDGDQANAGQDNQRSGRGGPRQRWMRQAMVVRAALLFHRIDKDESGQISKQEAEDAASRLFARLDRNKDGVISLDDMPDRPFL